MYINPKWRILTIGDGDLSFSYSLVKYHQVKQLTATVFDDLNTLNNKYAEHYLTRLQDQGCRVFSGFDVTDRETWGKLSNTLLKQQFDLVIFQFPLVPAFACVGQYQENAKQGSVNTLNRRLLRRYLLNCFDYFLAPDGERLAYITSKDVKPYRQWHIETALTLNTDINFIGTMNFAITEFPEYKIRNVDRDKHVKDTEGLTYLFCDKEVSERSLAGEVQNNIVHSENYCQLCRVGPFMNKADQQAHEKTKKHQLQLIYEAQWLADLANLT